MKKWIFFTCCIIVCLSCLFFSARDKSLIKAEISDDQKPISNEKESKKVTNTPWDQLSTDKKCYYQLRILKKFLYPYLQDAVNEYYGEYRQYNNATILSIEPTLYGDTLKIQVQTFVGPHNPPYGLDTITLHQDSSGLVVVQDFTHNDITSSVTSE